MIETYTANAIRGYCSDLLVDERITVQRWEIGMARDKLFVPKVLKDGSAYIVIYAPGSGPEQQISGFSSEIEAEDWISKKSKDWLKRIG